MTEEDTQETGQAKTAALSRELSEFLLELSIGVHRYAMYPPGHPSLVPAAENIIGRLGELFSDRRTLSIGVAREQLVIEGVATESKHPVLRDLAKRLHNHQLGAISFTKGVVVWEIEGLLSTIAQDPEGDGEPLGLLPSNQLPSWEHARLFPLGYDQLEMKHGGELEEEEPERATYLWLGLARSAMATEDPEKVSTSTGAETVAESIRSHNREAAYDQVIVGYLLQLAEELKSGKGGEAESVRQRVSTLIRELDPGTLERLVSMGGSLEQRQRFVLDANQSLAVDSVMKILQAAASASEQTISHSLTRLLSKLSVHAESGSKRVRDQADTALRDNVEELIKDWELKDPNPDAYTLILDSMANSAPVFQLDSEDEEESLTGAHRLLQMSLEVDSWGPTVVKAVSDLVEVGEVAYLLELADTAEVDSKVAEKLKDHLTNPKQLKKLLAAKDVEESVLRSLVGRMGDAAIPPLLEALTESESRAVRRKVFDILSKSGPEVGVAIMERLDEPRWFVVRNMLALVQKLETRPEGFSAGPFLEHEDARVRREAFPLALAESGLRERALALGLSDEDERLLRMALLEVQEGIPETLVPVLVNRVIRSDRADDLRAIGVRALGKSRSPLTLEALLETATAGKTLLGRRKIASPTPAVLAALRVLASGWGSHPKAQEIMKTATRSKDLEIRQAVSGEAPAHE